MPWNCHMSCVQHTWNRHIIYTRAHIIYVIVVSLFSSSVPARYKVAKSTTLLCTYALTSIIIFIVACSVISLVDNRMLPWLSLVLCKFWFTHEFFCILHTKHWVGTMHVHEVIIEWYCTSFQVSDFLSLQNTQS